MPRKVEEGSRVCLLDGEYLLLTRAGLGLPFHPEAECGTWPLAFATPLLGHGG